MSITQSEDHKYWMKLALDEAVKAKNIGEIPVGAVIVKNNRVIASSHNLTNKIDQVAHAEKLVIDKALKENKYLYDCTLYVTLEPCVMCAGAIILSRIGKVIFGAPDEKGGAVGSLYNLLSDKRMNHNPIVVSGVLAKESSLLLKEFFKEKRK